MLNWQNTNTDANTNANTNTDTNTNTNTNTDANTNTNTNTLDKSWSEDVFDWPSLIFGCLCCRPAPPHNVEIIFLFFQDFLSRFLRCFFQDWERKTVQLITISSAVHQHNGLYDGRKHWAFGYINCYRCSVGRQRPGSWVITWLVDQVRNKYFRIQINWNPDTNTEITVSDMGLNRWTFCARRPAGGGDRHQGGAGEYLEYLVTLEDLVKAPGETPCQQPVRLNLTRRICKSRILGPSPLQSWMIQACVRKHESF